jgi:hypothetical protein
MRSFRFVASMITVAMLVTACGSDSTITAVTNTSLAGVYTLRNVNGTPLPALIQTENESRPKVELLSDEITVLADGSWTGIQNFRVSVGTESEVQTFNSGGSYSVSGVRVDFQDTAFGSIFSVSVSGSTFTLSDGVSSYLYSK